MDLDRIARYVPDLCKAIHLICGPAAMIASLREGLASLGVPADRIRFEAFESAVAAASRVAVPGGETWGLTLARSGRTVRVSAPATLLDAAEAEGVAIDSLCRAGQCGTCRTRLLSGRVEGAGTALSSADREAGWVLPCVSVPRSDCTLDA
jgi:ferredoxin